MPTLNTAIPLHIWIIKFTFHEKHEPRVDKKDQNGNNTLKTTDLYPFD